MAKPDYYEPTDCETHDKGAPKFCKKSEPGEGAERSCAYDGARVVLMPITDVIHLVHGPIACAGNSWDNRGARSSGSQLYRRGFTTEILENDVVFGGEKKLYKAILELAVRYRPKAIFVYATCVTSMNGDDIEAVCKAAQEKTDIPLIPVNTPGFIGDKNIGNRLAGEVLFKYVIGTAEPPHLKAEALISLSGQGGEEEATEPYKPVRRGAYEESNAGMGVKAEPNYDINLIGEYNIAGDLWGMLPLFDKLGIRVLSCFSGDAKFEELRYAHRAKLNVIICSKSLTNLAKKMQKKYGMPYLEESFYGMTDTAKALRDIARELDNTVGGLEKRVMQERVERLIEEEEAVCREKLAPYRKRLEGKRSVLFTGGVKTWSMVNALRELGVEILAAGTQNSTLEDFYRMKALMHKDARIIDDTSSAGLLKIMYEKMPDLIVAGGKTKFLALKTKTPFLDINHGRSHPYAGYEGMVTFARQLDLTVNNPIWPVLNAKAPWEKVEAEVSSDVDSVRCDSDKRKVRFSEESQIKAPAKHVTVNPQKNSPALGATLAFLGIDRMLGLLHGAQGCSTFIRLQLSRHFKEPIALNSTSMSEDSAIFGGWENLKKGVKKVVEKFNPGVVGIMTSGLTETMGDDVASAIVHFRRENPELAEVPIIHASTPDYCGSLQEGYAAAVEAIVAAIPVGGEKIEGRVNILPGAFLTPADVEEVKEICEAFGLNPVVIPDISCALDGHIDETVSSLSVGGIPVERIREAGRSAATIFIGDSLEKAARILNSSFAIPAYGLTSITGLAECDLLMEVLSEISGRPVPVRYRRHRSRLMDAMVDSHYQFGNKKVSLALEGDLLKVMASFLAGMGCRIKAAVSATRVRGLDSLPAERLFVGDLEDLESVAEGSDLLVANSNGRQAAAELGGIPHLRAGLPVFDRLGAHQKMWVGYRGSMNLLFETANIFQANAKEAQKLAHN